MVLYLENRYYHDTKLAFWLLLHINHEILDFYIFQHRNENWLTLFYCIFKRKLLCQEYISYRTSLYLHSSPVTALILYNISFELFVHSVLLYSLFYILGFSVYYKCYFMCVYVSTDTSFSLTKRDECVKVVVKRLISNDIECIKLSFTNK